MTIDKLKQKVEKLLEIKHGIVWINFTNDYKAFVDFYNKLVGICDDDDNHISYINLHQKSTDEELVTAAIGSIVQHIDLDNADIIEDDNIEPKILDLLVKSIKENKAAIETLKHIKVERIYADRVDDKFYLNITPHQLDEEEAKTLIYKTEFPTIMGKQIKLRYGIIVQYDIGYYDIVNLFEMLSYIVDRAINSHYKG